MKYQVTKKQLQKELDKAGNVCDRCGRDVVPLKTVNNSGQPTYWAGCMHGQTEKGAWGHFTHGVDRKLYELAIKLVLEDTQDFGMSYKDKELGSFDYAWQNAVSRTCGLLKQIEYIKTNDPRYTKEQLVENFNKYYKK